MLPDILLSLLSSAIWSEISDVDFLTQMQKTYENAVRKYSKGRRITNRVILQEFPTWQKLQEYTSSGQFIESYLHDFISVWESELRNNQVTYNFIIEKIISQEAENIKDHLYRIQEENKKNAGKVDGIYEDTHEIKSGIGTINTKLDIILLQNTPDNEPDIPTYHEPEDFIARTVTEGSSDDDFLALVYGKKKEAKPLLDYVIDYRNNNRILLFSEGHRGKSYELQYLASQLQQSGIFVPYLYLIRNYTQGLTEQIPLKTLKAARTKAVLLFDGLDEVKGNEKDQLIREINKFAETFAGTILISCRSNFEEKSEFADYKRLMLNTLSFDTVTRYVSAKCKKADDFMEQVETYSLWHLVYIPFYLKFMVAEMNGKGSLPTSKREIYDLIIEESTSGDMKRYPVRGRNTHIIKARIKRNLLKLALCMQLTEKNSFTADELAITLKLPEEEIDDLCYLTIFAKKDTDYSFEHNIFKEHLIATELLKHPLATIRKLICYPQTDRIRPNWFNILVLYISYMDKSNPYYHESAKWFSDNAQEIIINSDVNFLDDEERFLILKRVLEQYKEMKIFFDWQYNKILMSFANTPQSILFLLDELHTENELSRYALNLLNMLQYADWDKLTEVEAEKKEYLFEFFAKFNHDKPFGHYTYNPFNNSYFYNEVTLERLYPLLAGETNPESLNNFMELIYKTNCCDKYAKDVFSWKEHIHNYLKDGVTHMVSKTDLYNIFRSFKEPGNIGAALKICLVDDKDAYENSALNGKERLIENLITNSIQAYKGGYIEILDSLLSCIKESTGEHYSGRSNNSIEKQNLYLHFFNETGLNDSIYLEYVEKCRETFDELLAEHSLDTSEKLEFYSYVVSLLLTRERCIELVKSLDGDEQQNYNFTTWFYPIANELSTWFSEYCKAIFHYVPPKTRDYQQESQDDFDLLFDYEGFKKAIEDIPFEKPFKKGRKLYMDVEECFQLSANISSFLYEFTDEDENFVDITAACQSVKEKETFLQFQFIEIGDSLKNDSIKVSEHQKQYIKDLAKDYLETIFSGNHTRIEFDAFLQMLFFIKFDLDESLLLRLVRYGDYPVHLAKDNDYLDFSKNHLHNLLECLTKKVDKKRLINEVVSYLKDGNRYSGHFYEACLMYIIAHKASGYYQLLISVLKNKVSHESKREYISLNVICRLAESDPNAISLIKKEIHHFSDNILIHFCRNINKYEESSYINEQMERIYKEGKPENSVKDILSLLLYNGSVDGLYWFLKYIQEHEDSFKNSFPALNYSDPRLIFPILRIFEIVLKRKATYDFSNAVHNLQYQLEKFALINEQHLVMVQNALSDIIRCYDDFHYLNHFRKELPKKFYENHNRALGLDEAEQYITLLHLEI